MKKYLLAVCLFVAFSGGIATKAYAEVIGYVDMQDVFVNYKKIQDLDKQAKEKKTDFDKKIGQWEEKIKKAESDKKPQAELDRLKKERDDELNPQRDALMQENNQKLAEVQQDIIAAVKSTAEQYGVDVVLAKQVILFGAWDLTAPVLKRLNK